MNTQKNTDNDTIKTVHTYKEMMEIAGKWATVLIRNSYTRGSNSFVLSYEGKKIRYQNDDIYNVASMASNYNGFTSQELHAFYMECFPIK